VRRPEDRSAFWSILDGILPVNGDALDLGTGTGRVAVYVAAKTRSVVGVDVDDSSLEAARWDAARKGAKNASFVKAEAETADLLALNQGRPFRLITARLFLSRRVLERIPALLDAGGNVVVEALEESHWSEAGGSRFNLPVQTVIDDLQQGGLTVRQALVETATHPLADAAAAKGYLKDHRLWTKWHADGRWERLKASIRTGGASLTEAYLVVWAHRPSG